MPSSKSTCKIQDSQTLRHGIIEKEVLYVYLLVGLLNPLDAIYLEENRVISTSLDAFNRNTLQPKFLRGHRPRSSQASLDGSANKFEPRKVKPFETDKLITMIILCTKLIETPNCLGDTLMLLNARTTTTRGVTANNLNRPL